MSKKKVVLTLTALFVSSIALASNPEKTINAEKSINFVITPSIAYRYDVFKWSIPSSFFPQKKLSELVWKNHIIQPSLKLELEPKANQFTLVSQVKYGHILKNQSKSWDYDWHVHRDSTGNVISEPDSTTKDSATGNILDLSGAIGYSANLFKNNLLIFYVGYDYTDYRNKNYGSRQLIYNAKPMPSDELSCKYNYKTHSPWIGLSVNAPLNEKFAIAPTIKFYAFKHIGKAYWIHRSDLKQNPSFKNSATGTGVGFDLDCLYKYSDNMDFKINLETKKFKMSTGEDKMFYNAAAFGGERTTIKKLLDLSLISSLIRAGFKYKL